MKGNNNYNYYAIQFIPDDKDIYTQSVWTQKRQLQFNGRNTWKDWHLIPSSRPVINPPTIKSNYIDIPGGNGTIDASTILTDYPVYNDREGSIEYYVTRNYDSYASWIKVYSDVMNYLGGKKFKVILEEDPGFFYRGRVNVNQWKSEKDWSKITLDYHLEPFKYETFASTDRWLWNPFSFVDGVITPEANGRSIYNRFIINNSNREAIDIDNYNKDKDHTYGVRLPITPGTMPICPEFSIKCNTSIVTSTWMHILQIRKYSGNRLVHLGHQNPISFTNNNTITKRIYDMNFYQKDYEEFIFFEVPSQYEFEVTVNFRRGWL